MKVGKYGFWISAILVILVTNSVVSGVFLKLNAQSVDFSMTDETLRIKARDILEKVAVSETASIVSDIEQYLKPGIIWYNELDTGFEAYNNSLFYASGKGDIVTFTVDFGAFDVCKMSYSGFGGSSKDTVFEVYAGANLLGTGTVDTSSGWGAEGNPDAWTKGDFTFEEISGVQTISIKVIESEETYPSCAYGNFVFYDASVLVDFTMKEDMLKIKARDIIEKVQSSETASINSEPSLYERPGIIWYNELDTGNEDLNNSLFYASGKGDVITFLVDFKDYTINRFSFSGFGGNTTPTKFEVYADTTLLGECMVELSSWGNEGIGDNWVHGLLEFSDMTGIKQITIKVIDSEPVYPSCAFGNFVFYGFEETTPSTEFPETENPETGNNRHDILLLLCFLTIIIMILFAKSKKNTLRFA